MERECAECGQRFHDAQHRRRHLRIHTGERPFQCFYCDYRTNRTWSLKSHCMRKHEMTSEEFAAKVKEFGLKENSI